MVLVGVEPITEGGSDTLADELRRAVVERVRAAEVEREVECLREGVGGWRRRSWSWK